MKNGIMSWANEPYPPETMHILQWASSDTDRRWTVYDTLNKAEHSLAISESSGKIVPFSCKWVLVNNTNFQCLLWWRLHNMILCLLSVIIGKSSWWVQFVRNFYWHRETNLILFNDSIDLVRVIHIVWFPICYCNRMHKIYSHLFTFLTLELRICQETVFIICYFACVSKCNEKTVNSLKRHVLTSGTNATDREASQRSAF